MAMRETESLLIAAQNNAIWTTYVKAKIETKQQNCRHRLCGDREKTLNHIISECSKLTQKEYKTRHGWVGKVIYWEFCKKIKFNHTNKLCMPKPEPILEHETHNFFFNDFTI